MHAGTKFSRVCSRGWSKTASDRPRGSLSSNFGVKHSTLEMSIWVTRFANRSLETFAQLTYPGRNVCDLCKYVFSTLCFEWNGNVNAFAYPVRTSNRESAYDLQSIPSVMVGMKLRNFEFYSNTQKTKLYRIIFNLNTYFNLSNKWCSRLTERYFKDRLFNEKSVFFSSKNVKMDHCIDIFQFTKISFLGK